MALQSVHKKAKMLVRLMVEGKAILMDFEMAAMTEWNSGHPRERLMGSLLAFATGFEKEFCLVGSTDRNWETKLE